MLHPTEVRCSILLYEDVWSYSSKTIRLIQSSIRQRIPGNGT